MATLLTRAERFSGKTFPKGTVFLSPRRDPLEMKANEPNMVKVGDRADDSRA